MQRVMVFGTFDHLHKGHRFFLQEAAKRGQILTAVLAVDAFVRQSKQKEPQHSWSERKRKLLKSGLVDQVLASDFPVGGWQIIDRERPDVICIGHDQQPMVESLKKWLNKKGDYQPELVVLEPFQRNRYSSSRISRKKNLLFYLLLVVAMLLWGLSWVSAKFATAELTPQALLFWRFLISTLSFLPFALHERSRQPQGNNNLGFSLLSALLLIIYNYLFFQGLRSSMAGKGGVIVTTTIPLITLLISLIFLKHRPAGLQIGGFILGICGGVLLLQPWNYSLPEFMDSSNLLYLLAALTWALLTLTSRKAQGENHFFRFNLLLYGCSTILAFLFCFAAGIPVFEIKQMSAFLWTNIAYLGLFAGSLATAVYFKAGKKLGAAQASSFTFIVPGSALLFSFIILGERPEGLTLIGALLAMIGLFCINYKRKKK